MTGQLRSVVKLLTYSKLYDMKGTCNTFLSAKEDETTMVSFLATGAKEPSTILTF